MGLLITNIKKLSREELFAAFIGAFVGSFLGAVIASEIIILLLTYIW